MISTVTVSLRTELRKCTNSHRLLFADWIRGRVDDVINVSGHRLSTAEIESALIQHPGVAETAVVGVRPFPLLRSCLPLTWSLFIGTG